MPSAITPILPFYDVCSSAPLPCAPIPTDQQELWGKITQPSGLLADEVLTPSHLDAPHHRASLSPSPLSAAPQFKLAAAKSPARILSPAPYRKPLKPARGLSKALDMSDEGSSSESSDSGSTLSTISEESDSKIPKPPGEPGRPGRGGYNLETALGWKLKTYSKLKKHVYDLIDNHLDTSKCASVQSTTLVQIVQDKASSKFPELENYIQCWPVTDLIMLRLKYTSSRARKQEIEMAAGKNKKSTK